MKEVSFLVGFFALATSGFGASPVSPVSIGCPISSTGEVEVPFSITVTASGGTPPYTFSVATGTLPAGLTLNPTTGAITGTPAAVGTFTIGVTDSTGAVATATCPIAILSPPSITKTFGATSIAVGGSTSLTFTIANSNAATILTGIAFKDSLPAGLTVASPSGLTDSCSGGIITAMPGSATVSLVGGALAAGQSCTFSLNVTGIASGTQDNVVTVTSTNGGIGNTSIASIVVLVPAYLERYAANLNIGESYIDIVNTGANGAALLGPGFGAQTGNICVNVYAFDPGEELISCCSCLVTPDQTVNLGVNRDLTVKTLTGAQPTSVTVKMLSTLAGGDGTGISCTNSAATVATATLAAGLAAWGTTLHSAPSGFSTSETPFTPATLSPGELASINGRCASIVGNGSGFGICNSCRAGALGGTPLPQ